MKAETFAQLVELMEQAIALEDDDRAGWVYPRLAEDMAVGARAVYDACLRGSEYEKH